MTRRFTAVIVATLGLTLSIVAVAPSASSLRSGGTDVERAQRLRVVEQTAWVAADGEFRLKLQVDRPPPGAAIAADLHSRVSGRIQFNESLTGERLGQVFASGPAVPLDTVEPATKEGWRVRVNGDGTVDLNLAVRTGSPFDANRTLVPDAGVYPLVVSMTDADGELVDQLVTHLVRLPQEDDDSPPLQLSLVVPVHAPVALQPDGSVVLPPEQVDRLEATITALADHPNVPLGVLPTAETVAAMAQLDDPVLADLLGSSLEGRQVLGAPYVDLDLSSWVASGLDDGLAEQFTSGADQLALDLDVRPDGRTWIADPAITPEALTSLRELGVDQVVLPEQILGPLDEDAFGLTLTQTFDVINSSGGRQRAIMADTGLSAHADATDDPVLNAHRLLADLAVLYFDSPALSRGAAVVLSSDAPPDNAFLDAVLVGLETPAIIAPVTLNGLFRDTRQARVGGERESEGDVLVRPFTPEPSPPLGTYPDELRVTQTQVSGLRSMLGAGQPLPASIEELELASGASGLSSQDRRAYLGAIASKVDETVAAVEVQQQAVTLTDRVGVIPVTVRNDLAQPVTVRVDVKSEKLEFPNGSELVEVVQPGITSLDLQVEARASGAFPVEVSVTSPDGIIGLSEGRITVRSTAVSGLGVILSVLAALFLLLWWARHFRSMRRAKRLVNTRHPAAQGQTQRTQKAFIEEITKH